MKKTVNTQVYKPWLDR